VSKEIMSGKYSIQLASRMSGVGIHTIRAWEKRYDAVTPNRSENGRREYNDQDIEKLTFLNELCTLGHSIGKIAHLQVVELKKLLRKLGKKSDSAAKHSSIKGINGNVVNIENSLRNLILALENYKLDIISHEINKLKIVLSSKQFALEIIGPLLNKVGHLVDKKEFSISQEHALSAILKFHIGHTLFKKPLSKSIKPYKILICAPEGDYHEFGILQCALLCNHYGFQFYYLGPNLPSSSLADTVASLEINIIIIGSTVIPEGRDTFYLNNYFNSVIKVMGKDSQLLIGGGGHLSSLSLKKSQNVKALNSILELDQFISKL
tara:strand:+ start:89139 stop:90101 length:963 start_codon:yes stop_codon:yes gene_type:complete